MQSPKSYTEQFLVAKSVVPNRQSHESKNYSALLSPAAIQIDLMYRESYRDYQAFGSSDVLDPFGVPLNFLSAYVVRRVLAPCEK